MSVILNPPKQQSIKNHPKTITIGFNHHLYLVDAHRLAHANIHINIGKEAYLAMQRSYEFLQDCIRQKLPVYGINTNFGDQVRHVDSNAKHASITTNYESIHSRQENIIRSLACSAGEPVAKKLVKTAMMLRAHCLAQGYSGINPKVVEALLSFINADIIPVVRQYGSIGASGDLIPLSSIAAALIGDNVDVYYRGELMRAPEAMQLAKLTAYKPDLRDGLALINGTSFMTAIASVATFNLKRLFRQMLCTISMTLEAMFVISDAYHPLIHQLKHHPGAIHISEFMRGFWQDSQLLSDLNELRAAHQDASGKHTLLKPMQDVYSLRSVAQGLGPFYENLQTAMQWLENEMNSVNDNPVIDAANKSIHHGANFMGFYVTEACDSLKMNIVQASNWLNALMANIVHPRKNFDLPANIVEQPETNNGFRSLQILMTALCVQNRKFGQIHASYMLPTEGDNQDVNSLGTHAALDLQEAVSNLEHMTAVMLLSACQALALRGIEKASPKAQRIYHLVRRYSPQLKHCRPMADELIVIVELLQAEKF